MRLSANIPLMKGSWTEGTPKRRESSTFIEIFPSIICNSSPSLRLDLGVVEGVKNFDLNLVPFDFYLTQGPKKEGLDKIFALCLKKLPYLKGEEFGCLKLKKCYWLLIEFT